MDQKINITNAQLISFCDRIKGCEDAIKNMNENTLNYIKETIDRIEKKQLETICTTEEKLAKHGERLDKQDNRNSYIAGALFVVSFVVGIIGTTIWNYYVNYPQIIRDAVKAEMIEAYQHPSNYMQE